MSEGSSAAKTTAPSLTWQRLRYSPLRDVVRGRLTGRLDVKGRLTQAELPQPLEALVMKVIRSTRLTRLERVEVADELIIHFQDGLEAGVEPAQLAKAFGEARIAGRLIGRAKKRNRPLLWRTFRRGAQAVGLVLGVSAVLYLIAAIQFFMIKPSPVVDYRLQINAAALAVPEADRAWPRYRQVLLDMDTPPDFSRLSNRDPRPGEPGWATIESFLDEHRDSLADLRVAARLPGFGFVTGYELAPEDLELWPEIEFSEADIERGGLYAVLLPYLAEIRKLAKVLRADMLRATTAGEGARVLDDVEALLGMIRHVREAPFIINDLVSLAIYRLALEVVGESLADRPDLWDDRQLQRLAHLLAGFDRENLRVRIECERVGFEDIAQRIYSDDGQGDGKLTARGFEMLMSVSMYANPSGEGESDATMMLAGPALRNIMLSRREMLAEYDRYLDSMMTYAATPLWRREQLSVETELEQHAGSIISRMRHYPLVLLMPALSRACLMTDLAMQHRAAILAAIALELHHRRAGSWPQSLDELTPELLPEPPLDYFDGAPLRVVMVDDRPVLYSVGADRDDDGGRTAKEAERWRPVSEVKAIKTGQSEAYLPDGDWVLWPKAIEPLLEYGEDEELQTSEALESS